MRFQRTALYNFRNFRGAQGVPVRFTWSAGLNVIIGPNGAGKTNLLESLNVLSGWGSFSRRVSGVISWSGNNPVDGNNADRRDRRARLMAVIAGSSGPDEHDENKHEIEARISSLTALRVDGKRETSTGLRLILPTVTFLPTDTGLIDGPPTVRRAFLDRLCALCIPVYAKRLADFRKLSIRRSAMLAHGETGRSSFSAAADLLFARLGGWIMEARRATVARLAQIATGEAALPGAVNLPAVPFSVVLTPAFNGDGESFLASEMRRMSDRERAAGRVLVGPGRMDLEINVASNRTSNELIEHWMPASEALSRGQKRRLVLALVLRAARLTESVIKRSPVLLLDDLAAELDEAGRRAAGVALRETGWQVILTSVEDPFPDDTRKTIHCLPV